MTSQAPLIDPADLGLYLNDPSINVDRASMMISDAMALAAPIFAPHAVPDEAAGVIRRIAGHGYVTTTTSRGGAQMAAAGSPMGGGMPGVGGVILTRYDRADLEAVRGLVYPDPVNGSGAGFSIDMLPAGYTVQLPPWDTTGYGWDYNGVCP